MRQGILGGSFDPVHTGHVLLAREIMREAALDAVRFLPAAIPPHKKNQRLAEAHHRVAMLKLSLAEESKMTVDEREILRGGTSYTVDSMRSLTGEFPDDSFFFIIGADSLQNLPNWYCIEDLSQMATFLVAARPGDDLEKCARAAESVEGLRYEVIPTTPQKLSSSEIRRQIQGGETAAIPGLTTEVESYIRRNSLYA